MMRFHRVLRLTEILYFLLLIILPIGGYGQELGQAISTKHDPVRIYQLIVSGRHTALTHTDSAITMLKTAVDQSEQLIAQRLPEELHTITKRSSCPEGLR